MFRHNLLIAIRNFRRHKMSFLINLIGLATGLASVFLICLWVKDEWGTDKFHVKDAQLFQVMERSKENGAVLVHDGTQGPLGEAMAKEFPEVEKSLTMISLVKESIYLPLHTDTKEVKSSGIFAGKEFFDLFSFPLLRGNPQQALAGIQGIVLTEGLAVSLFGGVDQAMGKKVEWEMFGKKSQAVVSGVTAMVPANSSMHFDFIMTYGQLETEVTPFFKKWSNTGPETYLLLKKEVDVNAFDKKIARFIDKYQEGNIFDLFVRRYSSAYLYGNYENGVVSGGRIVYVRLFSVVALFILVIACINFMNLTTARASQRMKEVGVKKVIGATRKWLVFQFLGEALLMTCFAFILTILIVVLVLPWFNGITGKKLSIGYGLGWWPFMLGVIVLTGLLAGSYPAFYLSRFKPALVLKGKLKGAVGELFARKGLVVFQFTISLVLIVSVMVVYRQVDYIQSKNLGYDKDGIIQFDKDGTLVQHTEAFLAGLKKIPGVENASAIQEGMVQEQGTGSATYGIDWPGKTDKDLINFSVKAVDYSLIETMGIQMKEGKSFPSDVSDTVADKMLLFNEEAIRQMGLKDPVGKTVKMWGDNKEIIGVVKDFHVYSLHEPIRPMVFTFNQDHTSVIMAKIAAGTTQATLQRINDYYRQFNPGYTFEYKFLDQAYQNLYVSERRVSLLSRYFAGLSILISCLGLFGLAAFNAEVRVKEIGIRKVLGASVGDLSLLLSKDLLILVVIAIVLAFPLAGWAMKSWLSYFAYRVDIGATEFIVAGVFILLISLLTVGYQSIRAALAPTR